jgi:hypothetical protein
MRAFYRIHFWAAMAFFCWATGAVAETNGVALTPALGWSSWSFIRHLPTEAALEAQARAMHDSGLQNHGFEYVNLDDFYYLDPAQTVDPYGRWVVNTNTFPDGMAAVANYVHSLGLKFGIYLTPGIPVAAYNQNTPIEGTTNHAQDIVTNAGIYEVNYNFGNGRMLYIDYAKPGAQAFINSWANLFASWGVDYVKIDGVGDWDIPDIQAWSAALNQSGRPIHLELSNSLDVNNGSIWEQYANGWRIDGDVECYCSGGGSTPYPLTSWNNVAYRFADAPQWTQFASPGAWNDLDSLEIGNGANNGLTPTECQTVMTLWSICCAPLILGTDLTSLDTNGLAMLCNDRVLQIDQAGAVGAPLTYNTTNQVWRAAETDGTFTVAFFNLGPAATNMSVTWTQLGFTNGAEVQDLWAGSDLGFYTNGYSVTLPSHGSALYRVAPMYPASRFLAVAPGNIISGGASVSSITVGSGGQKVGFIGNGGTLTFNNIVAPATGLYNVTFLYFNGDPSRVADISVNGAPAVAVTFNTSGSFSALASLTMSLPLRSGTNSIAISNPTAYAPDFDSLVVQSTTQVVPTAPLGLTATSGNSQVALSWLATDGATGYDVEYGTTSHVYTVTNTTVTAACTNIGLSNGTTYYFAVAANNSAGQGANSSEIAVYVGPPSVPTGLNAVPGNEQVCLTWNISSNATSYKVKRSSGGPYSMIQTVAGTNYMDASVANGTAYYYVVSAVNGLAESANSAQVMVTPGLGNGTYTIVSQASGLALDDPGGAVDTGVDQAPYSGVNQQWTIISEGADEYKIIAANGNALSGPNAASQLVVTNFTGVANQIWTFEPVNSYGYQSYYLLVNIGTGQVMDDFNNSTSAGSVIGQWSQDGGNNQNWALVPAIPQLGWSGSNGARQISWPAVYLGWQLQMQTNNLGTNWVNVTNSALSNSFNVPISTNYNSAFFRLVNP